MSGAPAWWRALGAHGGLVRIMRDGAQNDNRSEGESIWGLTRQQAFLPPDRDSPAKRCAFIHRTGSHRSGKTPGIG